METFELGFTDTFLEKIDATLDYEYTKEGAHYLLTSQSQELDGYDKISHCINTLECIDIILDWINTNNEYNKRKIRIDLSMTEQAMDGLDTDLKDSFFFQEWDNEDKVGDYAYKYMGVANNKYENEEDFLREIERLWNALSTSIKVNIFNRVRMNNEL